VGCWQGAEERETGLVFDPPGNRVFIICPNKGVAVGNVTSRAPIWFPHEQKDAISHLDVSPDNRLVATSSWDGTVVVWAFAPGEMPKVLTSFPKQRVSIWSVSFSPDGQRLAFGLGDGQIQIWDLQHRMMVAILQGHQQPVWDLAFNPDDGTLVSVSPDELRTWHVSANGPADNR
jgi:WD40 repeat protein